MEVFSVADGVDAHPPRGLLRTSRRRRDVESWTTGDVEKQMKGLRKSHMDSRR